MNIYETENIESFCEERNVVLKHLSKYITNFLGIDFSVKLEIGPEKDFIEMVTAKERFIIPFIEGHYLDVLKIIDIEIEKYLEVLEYDNIEMSNVINNTAKKIIFERLDNEGVIENIKIENFIRTLQEVSSFTYENEPINIGIFHCKTEIELEKIKNNLNYDYISFQKCEIKDFLVLQKPLMRIIDNKNFAIVMDLNFYVVGLIKRKIDSKPICEIVNESILDNEKLLFKKDIISEIENMAKNLYEGDFSEKFLNMIEFFKYDYKTEKLVRNYTKENKKKTNELSNLFCNYITTELKKVKQKLDEKLIRDFDFEKMTYITLYKKEVRFWTNSYFSVTLKKSNWRIENYIALAHDIFASINISPYTLVVDKFGSIIISILRDKDMKSSHEEQIKRIIEEQVEYIDEMSIKIFKLIKNIRKMSWNNEGALFIIITNEDYLNKYKNELIEKQGKDNNYKTIIKKGNQSPCITEINDEMIQSIAGVDGATIINRKFEIISFSEMIKSQEFDKSRCGKIYGARTNAAINATKFGTAIKVSEDGDISVFREVTYRNLDDTLFKRVEKVLSI